MSTSAGSEMDGAAMTTGGGAIGLGTVASAGDAQSLSNHVATGATAASKRSRGGGQKAKLAGGTAKVPKPMATHPNYHDMVRAAVISLNERKGSSRAAILKYIVQNFKVGDNLAQVNGHLRLALKRGVANGALKQTKGTGAAGSFRLGEVKKSEVAKKRVGDTPKPRTPTKSPAVKKTPGRKPNSLKKVSVVKSGESKAKGAKKQAVKGSSITTAPPMTSSTEPAKRVGRPSKPVRQGKSPGRPKKVVATGGDGDKMVSKGTKRGAKGVTVAGSGAGTVPKTKKPKIAVVQRKGKGKRGQ